MRNPACCRLTFPAFPCLLFMLLTSPSASLAAPLFPDPVFPAGVGAIAVAAADFNGDGILDLATANSTSGDLSILLGRGHGEFEPEQRVGMGGTPSYITAADLNADGKIDLVATDMGGRIVVFQGQGDGTFPSSTGYPVSDSPSFVTAADLNLDGIPDLAVANPGSDNVAVFRGIGNGAFAAPSYFPAGIDAISLVVVDFNRDGFPDLGVATAFDSKEAVMLFGHGNGQFDAPLPLGSGPGRFICSGDFNRDGRPDLAVIDNFRPYLSVFLGDGNGGVMARSTLTVGSTTNWVGTADFDGDGVLDLATAGGLLHGHGDGSFDPIIPLGAFSANSAIADLDADGSLDLAGANDSSPGGVFVLFNDGAGQLGARVYPTANFARTVVKGDFNGDGVIDLAGSGPDAGYIALLLGHGDGTFAPESRVPAAAQVETIGAGDFDGDGRLDLAFSTPSTTTVSMLRGLGNGTFQAPVETEVGITPTDLVTGDFNGDGRADLVSFRDGANADTPYLQVLLGNPDGTFALIDHVGPPQVAWAVAVGDFDGDGQQDLAAAHTVIESITILSGKGDGTFATGGTFGAGDHLFSLAVGDLNGDGKPDLAAGHSDLPFIAASNASTEGCCDAVETISVLLGRGNGSFEDEVRYKSGRSLSVGIADFDRDGHVDLLGSGSAFLPGAGDGTFGAPSQYAHIGPGVVDDFNQDGSPDVAVAHGGIIVALNQSAGAAPNHPPVAAAGPDVRLECGSPEGVEVLLDGSASSDPDSTPALNDIVAFDWFEDYGRPKQRLLGSGETLSVTLSLGTHRITLKVTDHAGAAATDDISIKVAVGSRCTRSSFIRRR